MGAEVVKQVAQETAWISSAWGYLLATAIGASFGGFVGSIAIQLYRSCKKKRLARERLGYILVEIRRGIERCKSVKKKLDIENKASFGVVSTRVWDSSYDLESFTRVAGRGAVDKILFIHEWFWQINANAIQGRPGPAAAYARHALDEEKIEDVLFQLEADLANKIRL